MYYFEVTVTNKCVNGRSVAVGVATKTSNLSKLPGFEHSSFGYHSDGSIYHGSTGSAIKFGPRLTDNDTVGCGIDFMSRSLFFTRNGVFLGKAFEGQIPASPGSRLYPAIGLQGRGARITVNFGQRPFDYAFDAHIKRERLIRENQLVEKVCKEDFAGPKMKELVSGYLVHHGYVATAQSFSRWASVPLALTPNSQLNNSSSSPTAVSQSPTHDSRSFNVIPTIQSRSCDSHIGSYKTRTNLESEPDYHVNAIPRRHSDSSFLIAPNSTSLTQLPGITSMLHRRRLRALCRRCQYGKAAATLNHFYPQVLERCPELLVQLRCRQLIEMMRRHAVRRDRSTAFDLTAESNAPCCDPAPPKVKKTDDSQHVRSGCCITDAVACNLPHTLAYSPTTTSDVDREATTAMEVDTDTPRTTSNYHNGIKPRGSSPVLVDVDDELADAEEEGDIDDFGLNDDTGVSLSTIFKPVLSDDPIAVANGMDVDGESSPSSSVATKAPVDLDELPCLLRQIQFGRSLVNLVKEVRSKTGGLSLETERLLQQSVSLLAYSTPTSKDCPLHNLLDPMWRDVIANVINSAVLKAHDLPVQPALEQGLRALRRCFQDSYFVEAQTLGHFLLYHLSPSKLECLDRAALSLESKLPLRGSGRCSAPVHSTENSSLKDHLVGPSRRSIPNGHLSGRRKGRRTVPRTVSNADTEGPNLYETEDCSSPSLDEVFDKDEGLDEDEEDEDEDEENDGERCRVDDDPGPNPDDDDDERDNSRIIEGSNQQLRDFPSADSRGSSDLSRDRRSPNGEPSSGRMHSIGYRTRHTSSSIRSSTVNAVSTDLRPNRQTVFARYCSAIIIDPPRARIFAAIPSAVAGTPHMSNTVRADGTSAESRSPRFSNCVRQPAVEVPSSQYSDSAFSGLLSMAYPQHTELLSAMNDALKVYAGSILTTEDDLTGPSFPMSSDRGIPPRDQHPRPPTGGACAP